MRLIFLATALAILSIPMVFKATEVAYYNGTESNAPTVHPRECPCQIKIDTGQREIVITKGVDTLLGEFFRIDSFSRGQLVGEDSACYYYCIKRVWGWRGKTMFDYSEPAEIRYEYGPHRNRILVLWTIGDSARAYTLGK